MAESPRALVANCVACGGTVPLRLLDPRRSCPYCDTPEPLSQEVAEKVGRLRAALLDHSAREQQLAGGQERTSPALPLGVIALFWTLVCGVHLAMFNEGLSGLPSLEFFLSDAPAGGDEIGYNARRGVWWVVYLNVTGIAVSALLGAWSGLIAGRVVVQTLEPLPPLSEDDPPRCRMCGADLPREGQVRRCGYCGSDHLLTGAAYRRRSVTLEESLTRLEAELGESVRARQEALENTAFCPLLLPLPLVFLGWALAFLPPAPAAAWAFTALAAFAALVTHVRGLLLPRITYQAGTYGPLPGDALRVGEARVRAWAELEVSTEGQPATRLLLVGAEDPTIETAGPALRWGLLLDWTPERPTRALRYRIEEEERPSGAYEQTALLHQGPTAKAKRRPILSASVHVDPEPGPPFSEGDRELLAPLSLSVSVPDAQSPLLRSFCLRDPSPLAEGSVALAATAKGRRTPP
jgi:predicted RNA-binding Zn-ribbon protein involved in translation (DUF1610 family)